MSKLVDRPPALPLQPSQGRQLGPSEISKDSEGNHHLTGSICKECNFKAFPPSEVCPDCLSDNVATLTIGNTGKLYCFTKVHVAPQNWVVPYFIGYVDMPEGVRLFGKIDSIDEANLQVDMPVTINFSDSDKNWRYFFSPTRQSIRS